MLKLFEFLAWFESFTLLKTASQATGFVVPISSIVWPRLVFMVLPSALLLYFVVSDLLLKQHARSIASAIAPSASIFLIYEQESEPNPLVTSCLNLNLSQKAYMTWASVVKQIHISTPFSWSILVRVSSECKLVGIRSGGGKWTSEFYALSIYFDARKFRW